MAGRREEYKKAKEILKKRMPGSEKLLTDWHHRAVDTLKALLRDTSFVQAIEHVKSDDKLDADQKTEQIYKQFELQMSMYELLRFYIATGQINHLHMKPPVYAVSEGEGIAGPAIAFNNGRAMKKWHDSLMKEFPKDLIYLVVNAECTQIDMKEWVNDNWTWFLQPRLNAIKLNSRQRIKTSNYIERDRKIHDHVKNKKPAREIITKGVDEDYVRVIAHRIDKKTRKRK